MDESARDNAWVVFDDYIDRVVIKCVNDLTPKWSTRVAGFDVYIWDQLLNGAEPAHRLSAACEPAVPTDP